MIKNSTAYVVKAGVYIEEPFFPIAIPHMQTVIHKLTQRDQHNKEGQNIDSTK